MFVVSKACERSRKTHSVPDLRVIIDGQDHVRGEGQREEEEGLPLNSSVPGSLREARDPRLSGSSVLSTGTPWGISPNEAATREGEEVHHSYLYPREANSVSFLLLHRGPRPCHGPWGQPRLPLSPGDVYLQGDGGTGLPRGPPEPPTFCSSCGRRPRAPGQRLCFPDSNYVCGSAAGAGDAAALHPEMTGDTREGGIGAEAPGRGGAHPAAGAPQRNRGPERRRPTHLTALSYAGHGEPCPRGAGRPLGAPGRRREGQSAACPLGR